MINIDLECMTEWRYCHIPRGQKGPRYANWQNQPFTVDQIPADGNVGVLLGPISGGLCALDFDGPSAWEWFNATFNREPNTDSIMWASGKTGRCQMAFSVPEQYWPYLKTLKIALELDPATNKHEGFEFRWTGGQSVLPPSLHPDTQAEYFWVAEPSHTDLQPLADDILSYWLQQSNPQPVIAEPAEPIAISSDDAVAIYNDLKLYYPKLDYDRWIKATWIICRQLGEIEGIAVMRQLYPEQTAGEYKRLLKNNKASTVATIGSVVHWIRLVNPEYRPARTYHDKQALKVLKQDNFKLKEMIRNG